MNVNRILGKLQRALDDPIAQISLLLVLLVLIVMAGFALDAALRRRRRALKRQHFERAARKSIERAAAAQAERKP